MYHLLLSLLSPRLETSGDAAVVVGTEGPAVTGTTEMIGNSEGAWDGAVDDKFVKVGKGVLSLSKIFAPMDGRVLGSMEGLADAPRELGTPVSTVWTMEGLSDGTGDTTKPGTLVSVIGRIVGPSDGRCDGIKLGEFVCSGATVGEFVCIVWATEGATDGKSDGTMLGASVCNFAAVGEFV